MIVDEDIYLEHFDYNVTIDQEVEEFLEHFGVMGMKWGVRRDRRANRFRKVGFGLGNKSEKLRSYAYLGPVDLIRGRGYKGGAARRGERLINSNQRIKAGKAKTRDVLTFLASTKYQDMFPTSKNQPIQKQLLELRLLHMLSFKLVHLI